MGRHPYFSEGRLHTEAAPWLRLYAYLSAVPLDTVIRWEDAALVANYPKLRKSRAPLARATEELQKFDNRTITGNSALGFKVVSYDRSPRD